MRRPIRSMLVSLALAATACAGGEESDRSSVVVTDSAGITIIDNGVLADGPDLLADSTPVLEIGVAEGEDAYQLFQITDAKRLSDGTIAVTNGGTRELRIYEADGAHRATAGGPGQGPGEFTYPSSLVILAGDTIQVQDFLDRVYFAPDGSFVRRETRDRGAFQEAVGGFPEGGAWLADGTYLVRLHEPSQGRPRPGPLYRPPTTLGRVPSDLSRVDTLGEFGGILQQFIEVGPPMNVMPIVPPFSTRTTVAWGSADATLVAADNANPQIHRFHADGGHSIVRWAADPEPVSESEVEAWKDEQRNAAWTRGQLPQLERGWASMDIPDAKPYYGQVRVGSDGMMWVSSVESDTERTTLRAFHADGRYAGTIALPGRFTVHDSGPDWVLGVVRDENDIEYLRIYALREGGA